MAIPDQRAPSHWKPWTLRSAHLSVNEDNGAEQAPRAALSVHVQHAQDLQEADAADGRGGEHLAVGPGRQHHYRRHHHDQICQVHNTVIARGGGGLGRVTVGL